MKHAPFSLFRVSAAALWRRKGASLPLLLLSALGVFFCGAAAKPRAAAAGIHDRNDQKYADPLRRHGC